MKNYYTEKNYKLLLNQICIIHTTNEQKNEHILKYFDEKSINHEAKALKTGDYCFRINACPDLGFPIDTYFTDELFIERKNSLDELAGSINDEAFHYELKRSQLMPHKFLLVEQPSGWDGIYKHDYRSKYNEKSYWNTLHTFEVKYGLHIAFVPKELMGLKIYTICKITFDSYILK